MNPFSNSLVFIIVIGGLLPFLLFPSVGPGWLPMVALGGVGIVLLLRALANRFRLATPADVPIMIMLAIIPVNLWASPDFAGSLMRTYPLIGAIALYWAVAALHDQPKLLRLGVPLLVVGVSLISVLIVLWTPLRVQPFASYQQRIIDILPGSGTTPWNTNPNPNLSAGILVVFWAPLVAVLIFGRNILSRLIAIPPILAIPVIAILASSRGALMGIAAAFAFIVLYLMRRKPILLALTAGTMLAVGAFGATRLFATNVDETVTGGVDQLYSLTGRVELWSRAQYMIQDFPFTGVGLNRVEPTVHILYPLFTVAPGTVFGHFHNLFLHTAGESGIPVLIAYLTILLALFVMAIRRLLDENLASPLFQVGLIGFLITYIVHGQVDVIVFSPLAATIIWALFGLVMATSMTDEAL